MKNKNNNIHTKYYFFLSLRIGNKGHHALKQKSTESDSICEMPPFRRQDSIDLFRYFVIVEMFCL